ncbi:unnamed protein product [Brassicogethes aeneus]|uniref:Uncharacterized protein n=1 Tax=Brassicogethes aeneus TaxID=1431903 RepID=A0A9P0FPV3_BRAAE|nr:unnamed protein product [Brassicogethes aeneus]
MKKVRKREGQGLLQKRIKIVHTMQTMRKDEDEDMFETKTIIIGLNIMIQAWYEEMINDRNKLTVDVIVGCGGGNRIWGKELKHVQLSDVQCSSGKYFIIIITLKQSSKVCRTFEAKSLPSASMYIFQLHERFEVRCNSSLPNSIIAHRYKIHDSDKESDNIKEEVTFLKKIKISHTMETMRKDDIDWFETNRGGISWG